MLQYPKSTDDKRIDAARRKLAITREHYGREETTKHIEKLAETVKSWLIANREKTDYSGNAVANDGPWWPTNLDYTMDLERLELRRSALRKKLFAHGLRRLLHLMVVEELLEKVVFDRIRKDTDFTRMALWEELVGYVLSPRNASTTLGLEDLVERFELAPGNNATNLRGSVVLPMAVLGIITARIDAENHYQIALGPVGLIFHRDVFAPVRLAFEGKLNGETK